MNPFYAFLDEKPNKQFSFEKRTITLKVGVFHFAAAVQELDNQLK